MESIIAQIDAEIARLLQARALLAGLGSTSTAVLTSMGAPAKTKSKQHLLSAEARKRIADAQRKRWAAHKAKSKSKK